MRETRHRREVFTDWAAVAVSIAAVGSVGIGFGDPLLLGTIPMLAGLLCWLANRGGQQSAAALIMVLGCIAGPLYGVYTPEPEQSVVAEVMWITVGSILGMFLLSFRAYLLLAIGIVTLVSAATLANPKIPFNTTLYFGGFITIIVSFGVAALQFVERQDARAIERENDLRAALESARQRADELAQARSSLNETRTQLVHVGRLASLGEVAAEVSHELNNPLTTVLMSSELLRDELRGSRPGLAALAQEVVAAAQACTNITERVLWYSRRQAPVHTPVALDTVVEHALVITRAPLRKAGCRVVVDVEPDVFFIGDAVQLTQVFVNLIINAKLVMDEGGTIEIKGGAIDEHIWVTIQDQGPGITAELRARVFEPFFSTRSEQGGSGLGLAISRAVVETHGGSLVLETIAPQPARFRIELPTQQAGAPALDAVTA